LLEAEQKLTDAQHRAEHQIQHTQMKMIEIQKNCEEKLNKLKVSFEDEISQRNSQLKDVESKLIGEKNQIQILKAELSSLRGNKNSPYSSDSK